MGLPEAVLRTNTVVLARERTLPVVPALEAVLPEGLRRGSTVSVTGSTSLALLLAAGPSQAGSWCAVVGHPALGCVAAHEAGVVLDRLALVADPGREWQAVVAALIDAVDVVIVGQRPSFRDARRLSSRARERGAVLVSLGPWEGADVRLSVAGDAWSGIGCGHGHLAARTLEVRAEGRGAYARPRTARVS
jgi:hypothetical protein